MNVLAHGYWRLLWLAALPRSRRRERRLFSRSGKFRLDASRARPRKGGDRAVSHRLAGSELQGSWHPTSRPTVARGRRARGAHVQRHAGHGRSDQRRRTLRTRSCRPMGRIHRSRWQKKPLAQREAVLLTRHAGTEAIEGAGAGVGQERADLGGDRQGRERGASRLRHDQPHELQYRYERAVRGGLVHREEDRKISPPTT